MAAASLHDAFATVTREVIATSGGEVIGLSQGEALAYFDDPGSALRAAVELDRQYKQRWDRDSLNSISVGIGIDTGTAMPVEGGYIGQAVESSRHLSAAATGGQIFIGEALAREGGEVENVRIEREDPSGRLRVVRIAT
jgi:class 3 adenylate cyclase